MATLPVGHLSLWMEDGGGAVESALMWAAALNVPLRAVVGPASCELRRLQTGCTEHDVSLEFCFTHEREVAVRHFVQRHGICVLADPADPELIRRSANDHEVVQLFCRRDPTPTRILVLWHSISSAAFLKSVAGVCRAFDERPIILIVAPTEQDAQSRLGFAEGLCGSLGLDADFDLIIDSDLHFAVGKVAGWRNCSHLIVERHAEPWWRRLHGDPIEHLRREVPQLDILVIPEGAALELPRKLAAHAPGILGPEALLAR